MAIQRELGTGAKKHPEQMEMESMKMGSSDEQSSSLGEKSETSRRQLWRDLTLLVLGAGILFGVALGARDLWNPNEAIYGRAVVEMDERGDWLVPTVNGKLFAEKPILYYWAALTISYGMGGIDELSLRVPSALAGILSVLLLYFLVDPYTGRRRALLAAALLATQYEVFWSARSVQMDSLVLVTTLGMLLPLSRMLDFGLSPRRAWPVVGLVAGVGLLAKGPVTCIVPGAVFLAYCASRRLNPKLLNRGFVIAGILAVAVAATWYGLLIWKGRSDILDEVLIRQNMSRFSKAWDHQQPWWYYLKYFWIEFVPWSWMVPAAFALRLKGAHEQGLHRLAWGWIVIVIFFFSLSDSKRAPYILPVAPAVAILASAVIDRLISGALSPPRRRGVLGVFGFFGILFTVGALALLFQVPEKYPDLTTSAWILSIVLLISGFAVLFGIAFHKRNRATAPLALLGGMILFYLTASIIVMPAVDSQKSARTFCETMNAYLETEGSSVVSYEFWDWRAGYPYYARRIIPNYNDPHALKEFWLEAEQPFILVEAPDQIEVEKLLSDERLVHQQKIGSRTAYLFTRVKHPYSAPGP